MRFLRTVSRKLRALAGLADSSRYANDEVKLLAGRLLAEQVIGRAAYASLAELEFGVFSQFGDDGIIQYLVHHLDVPHRGFVEFGVEDYLESNTRFLLQKDNWSGFVMDASEEHMASLRRAPFFWRHDLNARAAFVSTENIRELLAEGTRGWPGIGLLHIDIDGNDYWIWRQIDLAPAIVIVEYNGTFGAERAVTIPYAADFQRTRAHSSNLYWGCSLKALCLLAAEKGYDFVGCNGAGNNAYFVRRDVRNERVARVTLEQGFVAAKYRESRDAQGKLTYLAAHERAAAIRGLPVYDVEKDAVVPF